MISENELTPDQKYKMEQVLFGMKKNKRNFVKKYGMKAEALMKKRALKIAKQHTPEPTSEEMKNDRLKKLIQDVLSKPLDETFPDLTGDNKVTRADILKGRGVELEEDLDLGHTDNEPHMIKAELAQIGKYAMELYKMVDQFEGEQEVDFPAWWQSKITSAKNMISSAKHYLDFELNEPQIDAMVGIASEEDIINEYEDKTPKHKIVRQWVGPNSDFYLAHKKEEYWDDKDYDVFNRLWKMVGDEGKIPSNLEEKMSKKQVKKRGKIYDALKDQGMSDEKAGRIATAKAQKIKEAVLAKLKESKK